MNLFYSELEKRAFYIPNYYMDSQSNVEKFCANLLEEKRKFAGMVGCMESDISTIYITESSRYKYMRAFYVWNIEVAPKDAFALGSDWTMFKWIEN